MAIENEEDEEKMYGEEEMEEINKKNAAAMTEADGEAEPTGKVVGIIRKKWRPYCGFIVKNSVPTQKEAQTMTNVIFRAIDRRIPPIRIRTSQASNLVGNRIVVSIDNWFTTSR